MKVNREKVSKKQMITINFTERYKTRGRVSSNISNECIIETISKELMKKSKKKTKPKYKSGENKINSITLSTKHNSLLASNSFKSNYSSDLSEGLNIVLDLMSPAKDQILFSNNEKSDVQTHREKHTNYFIKFETMLIQNKINFSIKDVHELMYLLQIRHIKIKENNPLLNHRNIKLSYRQKLLVWISDLCVEFKFERLTFYQSLSLIDLFLSKTKDWESRKFQLLGIAALSISSKFFEVYSNKITTYTEKSHNAYNSNEIKRMEIDLLMKLDYNISFPNIYNIVFFTIEKWDSFILKTSLNDNNHKNVLFIKGNPNKRMFPSLIQLLDLTVLDYKFLKLNPFKLSSALIYSILLLFSESEKPNILVSFLKNGISNQDMNKILRLFLEFLEVNFLIKFSNLFKSFNFIGTFIDLYLTNFGKTFQLSKFYRSKLLHTPYENKEKISSFFENLNYRK